MASEHPRRGDGLVLVPRLTSRSGIAWLIGTLVVSLGALTYLGVTEPRYAVGGAALGVVVILAGVAAFSGRQWLDPGEGTVTREWLWCRRRTIALIEARSVRLVNNRGGGLNLTIRPSHGRTMLVPVLLLSDHVQRSQSPEILRLLADQVQRSRSGGKVPDQLRRQAVHLEKGGTAQDSPLSGLVTHGVMTAAKAGGAAGGSSLLD